MDFAIEITDPAAPGMAFTVATGLFNNIFLSLTIKQGSWWLDPTFGLRDRGRMKNTEQNARLVREDCKQALQWLLDTGRAASIDVYAERDRSQDLHRLKVLVVATEPDGRVAEFEKFIEVV